MKFTLTYEGQISTSGGAKQKHQLRKHFHKQLKRLWDTHPFLKAWQHEGEAPHLSAPMKEYIAGEFSELPNYQFLPLVTKSLCVDCALRIRLFRSTERSSNIQDIDNLLKPLFDGLQKPDDLPSLGGYAHPDKNEVPFFVLAEDDSLISKISSVTDELLEPINGKTEIGYRDIRLLIDVFIRPIIPKMENSIFYSNNDDIWDLKLVVPDNLTTLTDYELKALTTQIIFRINALGDTENQGVELITRLPDKTEAELAVQYSNRQRLDDEKRDFVRSVWRKHIWPNAFSAKKELNRRVYGEGPYPNDRLSVIDVGMLAGIRPLYRAANELGALVRSLD